MSPTDDGAPVVPEGAGFPDEQVPDGASTPEPGGATPERVSVEERRRRREAEPAGEDEHLPAPLTRREMKARGILLTSEIPVVEPPDWASRLAAAHASERAVAERDAVEGVLAAGAHGWPDVSSEGERAAATAEETAPAEPGSTEPASAGPTPAEPAPAEPASAGPGAAEVAVPSRRALRERLREDSAMPEGQESPEERTGTGSRPAIRPPATARGIRTVDDTGAISAVQPVVRAPIAWAPTSEETPAVPAQPEEPVTPEWLASPSSWESAVSEKVVRLDVSHALDEAAASGDSPVPDEEEAEGRRRHGEPGWPGRAKPPEEAAGWSALLDEPDRAAGGRGGSPDEAAAPAEGDVAAEVDVGAEAAAEPDQPEDRSDEDGPPEPDAPAGPGAQGAADGERPPPPEAAPAVPAPRADAASARRQHAHVKESPRRLDWPFTGWVRVLVLVAVGIAVGVLIYLVWTAALGSPFVVGADHAGWGTPSSSVTQPPDPT